MCGDLPIVGLLKVDADIVCSSWASRAVPSDFSVVMEFFLSGWISHLCSCLYTTLRKTTGNGWIQPRLDYSWPGFLIYQSHGLTWGNGNVLIFLFIFWTFHRNVWDTRCLIYIFRSLLVGFIRDIGNHYRKSRKYCYTKWIKTSLTIPLSQYNHIEHTESVLMIGLPVLCVCLSLSYSDL